MAANVKHLCVVLCFSIGPLLCEGRQGLLSDLLGNNSQVERTTPSEGQQAQLRTAGYKTARERVAERLKKKYGLSVEPSADTIKLSSSKPGQSADGEKLIEKKGELYLDASPCEPDAAKKQIKSFTNPYEKQDLGDKECPGSGRVYRRYKVTQKK
jgi:hypothetical protein